MIISKFKLKNYLAETLANNILHASEEKLFDLIRYDGIKGFENYSDRELLDMLTEMVPEFKLTNCEKYDNNSLFLSIKKEYEANADDIKIDITRIIQMKMLA